MHERPEVKKKNWDGKNFVCLGTLNTGGCKTRKRNNHPVGLRGGGNPYENYFQGVTEETPKKEGGHQDIYSGKMCRKGSISEVELTNLKPLRCKGYSR